MADTLNSFSTNSLAEISFIGGTYRELAFDVYYASGSPVNLKNFASCQWLLSPFGQSDLVAIIKQGVVDNTVNNRFWVYLLSEDTVGLYGKYVQQPVVVASTNYEFRIGQGYVNISRAAGNATASDAYSFTQQLYAMSGSIVAFESTTSASIVSFKTEVSGSLATMPVPASGSTLQTGTNNTQFATALSLKNAGVPRVATTASNDFLVGNGTDWQKKTLDETKSILDVSYRNGWYPIYEAWTYASASVVNVPSGAASLYSIGNQVKIYQSSTWKYFYVIGITDTTLTLFAGSSFTIANATIDAKYFSRGSSTQDFPYWFPYTPAPRGDSGTGITFTNISTRFSINGRTAFNKVFIKITSKGTATGPVKIALPIPSANAGYEFPVDGMIYASNTVFPIGAGYKARGIITPGDNSLLYWGTVEAAYYVWANVAVNDYMSGDFAYEI